MKSNDELWKSALEDLFDDFLLFFYPEADKLFDLKKGFEYLDKELNQLFPPEEENSAIRFVDKLVKVNSRKGGEEWILIHIEVQGYYDKDFAERMFRYYYRILDRYNKPITAFAIFTDAAKKFHPRCYERAFLGTSINYTFNTYKIIDQIDAELQASNNPFAWVVLSAKLAVLNNKATDQQLFEKAFGLAKLLLSKKMPKKKIRKVMSFLKHYLRFDSKEMFAKFGHEVETLTGRSITMGIEEYLLDSYKKEGIKIGREEGREEGREKTILETALKMKKSGLAVGLIANITGLSVNEIEKLD